MLFLSDQLATLLIPLHFSLCCTTSRPFHWLICDINGNFSRPGFLVTNSPSQFREVVHQVIPTASHLGMVGRAVHQIQSAPWMVPDMLRVALSMPSVLEL